MSWLERLSDPRILMAVIQYELSVSHSKSIKRGMENARLRGKRIGRPPKNGDKPPVSKDS